MAKTSILVVEDEHIVARDIQARLIRLGYEVAGTVSTADEAIEQAGTQKPDLVLMDVMLSGEMDGIDAADRIRLHYDIPVIFLTAYADEHTLQRAKVTEAFGYLLKPFEERELHITIEMALYKHRMETQLREGQQWLATILRSIGDAVIAADTGGRITFMNPLAEQLTGWKENEAKGMPLSGVFRTAEDTAFLLARDGRRIPVDQNTAPIKDEAGTARGVVVVFRDVTQRKRAEEALQEGEQRYRSLYRHTPVMLHSIDREARLVEVSDYWLENMGYRREEVIGRKATDFMTDASQYYAEHVVFPVFFRTGRIRDIEYQFVKQNGEILDILLSAISETGPDGAVRRSMAVLVDVTELKRAERALKESEERYRRFFEDDLTGDYIASPDGKIAECNPAFARILGFASVEEARTCNINSLYPDDADRDAFFAILRKKRKLEYYEKQLVRPDGAPVTVIENVMGTFADNGELLEYKGYMFDNTERKHLEEQLLQSQKMESIGTVASGIAHDFNNILNNVMGFALQIKKHTDDPAKVLRYSQTIERSALRGAELSAQLLSFARKSKRENVPMNLGQIVDEVASLCTETFPKSIQVDKIMDPALSPVLGDHGELYQVLLNLCVNARDAITTRGGNATGKVSIEARNVQVGGSITAPLLGEKDDWCVEVRVSDNGIGIARKIIDKIFDPFFTTKERGQGTGLGLSVVYNIVRNHHGLIQVESEEGVGSTFKMLLPSARAAVDKTSAPQDRSSPQGDDELVMIVDDEESMQELGRELLEEKGYRVLIAGNGQEAVELYRTRMKEIALVILDLVMPGMDGGQTYLELKKINPGLRAFFCTGFMPDQVITALLEDEKLRAVQKPFNAEVFLSVVREVLDEKR